jgi:hypothetical protein
MSAGEPVLDAAVQVGAAGLEQLADPRQRADGSGRVEGVHAAGRDAPDGTLRIP